MNKYEEIRRELKRELENLETDVQERLKHIRNNNPHVKEAALRQTATSLEAEAQETDTRQPAS